MKKKILENIFTLGFNWKARVGGPTSITSFNLINLCPSSWFDVTFINDFFSNSSSSWIPNSLEQKQDPGPEEERVLKQSKTLPKFSFLISTTSNLCLHKNKTNTRWKWTNIYISLGWKKNFKKKRRQWSYWWWE